MARIPCPDRDQLLDYLLGRLPDDISEQIAAHLDECPTCESAAETLDQVSDTLVSELNRPLTRGQFESEPQYQEALQRVLALAGAESGTVGGSVRTLGDISPDLGQLGEYRLLEKLGEGGMGAVYKAQHTKLDKLVALKVLPKDRMQNPTAVSRFEREMKAVGRLNHPHIVQAHDAREIDGIHFLAMEYVEGLDLAKLVSHTGPLRVADACELVRQAAVGLQHAHEQGLVHRDIKPSNLMLSVVRGPLSVAPARAQRITDHGQLTTDHGQQAIVKILDLGLALLGTNEPNRPEMTAAGTAMGTADYVSPEQVTDSHSVDIRSDIYSLGCTLYKLLSGRAPFVGLEFKNDVTKMMAHVDKTPSPISLLRTDLPPGLAQVIERMMAKKPEDRFATPGEVAIALEPFAAGSDLGRLLNEASGTVGLPVVETSRSASTGKLSGSAHVDTDIRTTPIGTRPPIAPARGWPPRSIAIAGVTLAASFLFIALGIVVIRIIDKQGRETVMNVPDGSEVTVNAEGKVSVKVPGTDKPTKMTTEPSAKQQPVPKAPTVNIEPESQQVKPGEPISGMALVAHPAALSGVQAWTFETLQHRGSALAIAFNGDGGQFATGGEDGTVRVCDASNGKTQQILHGHLAPVRAVAWSPDPRYVASADGAGQICVWRLHDGRRLRTLRGHLGDVWAIAWSPDSQQIVSGGKDKTLRLWDAASGLQRLSVPGIAEIVALASSGDGQFIAAADANQVHLRSADLKQLAHTFDHDNVVTCAAFAPDSRLLATADRAGMIRLWDVVSGMRLHAEQVIGHTQASRKQISGLVFLPNGSQLLSVGADGLVHAWDLASGFPAFELKEHTDWVRAACCSADGKSLITSSSGRDGSLRCWDLASGEPRYVVNSHRSSRRYGGHSWSPDGRTIVAEA